MFENSFQNYSFKVLRGRDEEHEFALADFPLLNPNDLINLLKTLLTITMNQVQHNVVIQHIQSCLMFYYSKLSAMDYVLAKRFSKSVASPNSKLKGLQAFKDGKILQDDWGVMFVHPENNFKTISILEIDEKHQFDNTTI